MFGVSRLTLAIFGIFIIEFDLIVKNGATTELNDKIQLTTPNAVYRGRRLTVPDYPQFRDRSIKSVDQFVGIPYAEAPIGKLRFQKSVPIGLGSLQKSKPTIDALEWKPSCMQQPGFIRMLNLQTKSVSEDCLYLNVWSPNGSGGDGSELKPVLVWFHGGSFISDSSARSLYTGKHLAALADIVVVTINYRLDVYGFLYSGRNPLNGTDMAPGNQAIWDQLLALEWIQDNIRYFNGDPKLITIAGHNAGATSVGMHLLSPKSRRFFQRAYLTSGSIFSQLVVGNEKYSKSVAENWSEAASKIDCGSGGHHWTVETLKCLKKSSDENLLKMVDPLKKGSVAPEVLVGVDELFPFENLLEGIEKLKMDPGTTGLSVLFGSTNDEGSLVLPLLDVKKFSMVSAPKLSQREAYDEMTRLGEMIVTPKGVAQPSVNGDEVARFYINSGKQHETTKQSYAQLIGQALGDFYVGCPVVEISTRLARTAEVFQYVWSRNSPNKSPDMPCADWMGACHGTELVMLFGQPFELEDNSYFGPDDRRQSAQFIDTIGHFVRHGTPLKQEGKQWPSFSIDSKSGRLVAPYYDFSDSSNKSKSRIYKNDWKRELCRDLWAKYILPV